VHQTERSKAGDLNMTSTHHTTRRGPARCLIVDPSPQSAASLARLFEREGYETQVVHSGENAVELCASWTPDIVFLEWELPGIHGPRTGELLREACDPFLVMLSSRDSEIDRVTALSTIADDYVGRPYSEAEVVARTRAILRRQRIRVDEVKPPTVLEAGELSLDVAMRSASHMGEPIVFTRLEFDILTSLMRSAPRPVQRKTLIQEAWGDTSAASTHTLDVHASRLRQKLVSLGIDSVSIESIRGFGLRLNVREPADS
jgi:DNA-binding response OmpR family regulator